jgi:hypothetical protein
MVRSIVREHAPESEREPAAGRSAGLAPLGGTSLAGSHRWLLSLQRRAGNAATVQAVKHKAAPKGASPPTATPPSGSFSPAHTTDEFIKLIREAETKLVGAGVTSIDERIQILSGIYYGTDWSLDYETEQKEVRNQAFQIYTARATAGKDPRPILGTSLANALKHSQDVRHPTLGTVDIGHMIIGLNARASVAPRKLNIPTQGATGLEITTWVGDLGGAAAQLARLRVKAPSAAAKRFFSPAAGTDYGSDSNLEGDIAAYVAGATSGATSVPELTVPAGGGIADALTAYFGNAGATGGRAKEFLEMLGGTFSGPTLTNQSAIESVMAGKFRDFGRWYGGQRFGVTELPTIEPFLADAGRDVATEFMSWLLRRGAGASAPAGGGAAGAAGGAGGSAQPREAPEPGMIDKGVEWARKLL